MSESKARRNGPQVDAFFLVVPVAPVVGSVGRKTIQSLAQSRSQSTPFDFLNIGVFEINKCTPAAADEDIDLPSIGAFESTLICSHRIAHALT